MCGAARKDSQVHKLRDEKANLTEEVDELKSKIQRMSTMTKQVGLSRDLVKGTYHRNNQLG